MESRPYTRLLESASNSVLRRRRPLVSLTPLVDVVFILLIFFMLASSFSDQRVFQLLSPVTASESAAVPRAVLVRVKANDRLDLNGQPLALAELQGRAAQLIVSGDERQFLVQPDKGIDLQRVVTVLDALTAAGVEDVSLMRK